MLQKHELQALVVGLPGLKVVGRIEIEQRQHFGWAAHFQRVGLQHLNAKTPGLFKSVSVDLNAVTTGGACSLKQTRERHAISHTRIECRKLVSEGEAISEALGFR